MDRRRQGGASRRSRQALIAQYDGFEPRDLPGEHVNGALTVGENIGDLGGLTIALKAYLIAAAAATSALEDAADGCSSTGPTAGAPSAARSSTQQYLTIDPHSPPEFRANIVRNLDEFHATFGTQPGDGLWLDPEDRVRIW